MTVQQRVEDGGWDGIWDMGYRIFLGGGGRDREDKMQEGGRVRCWEGGKAVLVSLLYW